MTKLVATLLLLLSTVEASAAVVVFRFTAERTSVELAYAEYFGATGEGEFAIDTSVPGQPYGSGLDQTAYPAAASGYWFRSFNETSGFTLEAEGTAPANVQVSNGSSDRFRVVQTAPLGSNLPGLTLTDGTIDMLAPGTWLSSSAIISDAAAFAPLNQFIWRQFSFRIVGFPSEAAIYRITGIESRLADVTPVPLPAGIIAVLTGVGVLLLARRAQGGGLREARVQRG